MHTHDLQFLTLSEIEDCDYALDLKSIREAQLDDKALMKLVKQHIASNGRDDTIYTYKSVEDVPQSKQQRVLDWYHDILIHPGEKRMIATIKLVFTCLEWAQQASNRPCSNLSRMSMM